MGNRLTRREVGAGAVALLAAASARAETRGDSFEYDAVSNLAPARTVMWSWTTGEQVQELRAGSPLFSRVTNKDGERGYLYSVLEKQTGLTAELLRSARFDKGRYGWWNPWATCQGFLGERWGDQLLRVELSPRTWLAVVRSSKETAEVVDLDNRTVSEAELRASPERLAGAFFVHDAFTGREKLLCDPSVGGWATGYREVYLGDEALVRRWSLGTKQILGRLDAAVDGLDRLSKAQVFPGPYGCAWGHQVQQQWDSQERAANPYEAYRRALAFAEPAYAENGAGGLTQMMKTLRERRFTPDPLVVTRNP